MSWSELHVHDHKRKTDCAIHSAWAQLACDPPSLRKFQELLATSRTRASRIFEAPIVNGHHLGVDALVNLSRFHAAHIRPASTFAGTASSWRLVVATLSHHILCKYQIPLFLTSCWYAADPLADKKRTWFIEHARGRSFRSLHLLMTMTRKMEHIFLASPEHLSVEHAMRRAELLALGASGHYVKAVLTTPMSSNFEQSDFWRTVWIFLIANSHKIDPSQIAPLIDYITAARQEHSPDGTAEFGPPQPPFSLKGRTVESLFRLMQQWHRSLGIGNATLTWEKSPFRPLLVQEPRQTQSETSRSWHMMELTNSTQLRREGAALHHCVASYAYRCHRGASSIWSLRFKQAESTHHVLTVEIDPRNHSVVQARGKANRAASGKPLQLLQDWAAQERLTMPT